MDRNEYEKLRLERLADTIEIYSRPNTGSRKIYGGQIYYNSDIFFFTDKHNIDPAELSLMLNREVIVIDSTTLRVIGEE